MAGAQLYEVMSKLCAGIVTILYPIYCYGCRYEIVGERGLCDSCEQRLQPVVSTICSVTKKYELPVFAAYAYRGPICDIIRAKKRSDACAAHALALIVDEALGELKGEIDYLIPVPLHKTREAERGFNQAAVMTESLAKRWNVRQSNAIVRSKNTPYQASVSAAARQSNVEDAFTWADESMNIELVGKRICIVDDLFTTGATVSAIARLLIAVRPQSIMVIVAARAIDER